MRIALLALMMLATPAWAQPEFARGQKLVTDYFQDQVSQIEANCLTHLTTKAAWEKERVERFRNESWGSRERPAFGRASSGPVGLAGA